MPTYYYYLNGVYQFPVSHTHACHLIDVELPIDDAPGTKYDRLMGEGRFVTLEKATIPAASSVDYNEDAGVGYYCDGTPIGG